MSGLASVVVNPLDLTITTELCVTFLQQHPVALNGGLTNIAKEIVCRDTLVQRGDSFDDPVIIKTRLNWGAVPEEHKLRIKRRIEGLPGVEVDGVWATRGTLDPEHYAMFVNADRVPPALG